MKSNELTGIMKLAISELRIAENELNRPNEDVVTMSICLTARHSMKLLLRTFLLSKSIPHSKENSLTNLLNKCKIIDSQFESISLGKIFCNEMSEAECRDQYCLSTKNVIHCMAVALQLKQLILNKLEINESEIA
jgi:hypothetical protein